MSNKIKLVNKKTDYPLVFKLMDGNTLTVPPCLPIAKIYDISYLKVGCYRILDDSGKINVLDQMKAIMLVQDLPEPQKGVLYIVSNDVFESLSSIREDLVVVNEKDDTIESPEFRGQNLFVFDKSL